MIQVDLTHMRHFIALPYEAALAPRLRIAHNHLQKSDGPGGEFTGWVRLPQEYDREEFARIQAAAERIKKQSQVLVVVGIGSKLIGCGLGASAANREKGVDEYFYLDMLARTGIVGLVLYILPFGYVVLWCLRRRSLLRECPEGAAVVCGLCTFWVVTWFNPWMNAVLGIAWYAVTLSVPQALEEQNAWIPRNRRVYCNGE